MSSSNYYLRRRSHSLPTHQYSLRRSQQRRLPPPPPPPRLDVNSNERNQNTINRTIASNTSQQQQQRITTNGLSSIRQPITRCRRSEVEAEDTLFKEIQRLIHHFLTRPGRQYPYRTTMRWSTDPRIVPDYSVMIRIDQPCSSSSQSNQ